MKERPILFSGEEVRSTLSGQKAQTRRPVKPQPESGVRLSPFAPYIFEDGHGRALRPPCAPGDVAWVRETWAADGDGGACWYRAGVPVYRHIGSDSVTGFTDDYPFRGRPPTDLRWTPSIHMPRWASRITLPIAEVRVERVQSITEADARAEGVTEWNGDEPLICEMARSMGVSFEDCLPSFAALWITTYGREAWETNPWVWVLRWEKAEVRK